MKQQLNLFTKKSHPNLTGTSLSHGGNLRVGKRKIARPFDSKRPVHLILKSKRAIGRNSMLCRNHCKSIESLIYKYSRAFDVKILSHSNVGNHLHLVLKAKNKTGFKNFLRTVAGRIAIIILNAKKGFSKGRFWDAPIFTRVMNWGKDYIDTQIYITKNLFEGEGVEFMTPNGVRRFFISD